MINEHIQSFLDNPTEQAAAVVLQRIVGEVRKAAAEKVAAELASVLVGQQLLSDVLPAIDDRIKRTLATISRLEEALKRNEEARAGLIKLRKETTGQLDGLGRGDPQAATLTKKLLDLAGAIEANDAEYSSNISQIARQKEQIDHLNQFKQTVARYEPPRSDWLKQFLASLGDNRNGKS